MMYITVMRVNSAKQGRGINIFLHLPPGEPDPTNPWKVIDDPGPRVEAADQREVRPGGNRVEAYLDLFFDEHDYSREFLDGVLDQVARTIEEGTRNPAKMEFSFAQKIARGVFSVNLGLEDLASKRRVFNELRGALGRWEAQHAAELENAASGALQAAG